MTRAIQVAPFDLPAVGGAVAAEIPEVGRALHAQPALGQQYLVAVLVTHAEKVPRRRWQTTQEHTPIGAFAVVCLEPAALGQRLHRHSCIGVTCLPLDMVLAIGLAPDMNCL